MTRSSFIIPHSSFSAREAQASLALEGGAEAALRAAYEGSGLAAHGISFHLALREPRFEIPLRRTAEAALRAKQLTADERR